MTDHATLSRDLALALGWRVEIHGVLDYEMNPVGTVCNVADPNPGGFRCRKFDYRSPDVCLPLMEWLMLRGVNVWSPDGIPTVWAWSAPDGNYSDADTLPEAVARAVIAVKKGSA